MQAAIREARRLLHELVFSGQLTTKSGRVVSPKDEVFVNILEKIASRKVEEPSETPTVEGFQPQETYRTRPKGSPPDENSEASGSPVDGRDST